MRSSYCLENIGVRSHLGVGLWLNLSKALRQGVKRQIRGCEFSSFITGQIAIDEQNSSFKITSNERCANTIDIRPRMVFRIAKSDNQPLSG